MVALGWIPLAVGWMHLPDPAATHWGVSGAPDGRMPLWALPLLVAFIVGIGLVTTSLFRLEGRPTAEAFAMVGLLGGVGLSLTTSLVILNWDATSWETAAPFSWPHLVAVVVAGFAGVLVGYQLGKRWYPPPSRRATGPLPTIEVAEGERVSWVSRTTVRWPFLLLLPLSVVFLTLPGWFKLIGLAFVILALLFASVYVTVDNQGLRVLLGGGVRVKKLELDRITAVEAIDLEPSAWGGWGYRVIPGGSAVVLRRGDALAVTMSDDRKFAVTVDDAATGAALLNGLVVRLAREN
jgi:hypothetical protein